MKTATRIILGILFFGLLGFSPASAEWYVGGYAGVAIPTDKDVDIQASAFGLAAADTLKDVDLDTSAVFGGKVGHFFEGLPSFGLELEVYHFRPDADQQTVQTTLFPGGTQIAAADIAVTTIGLNALYRLQLAKSPDFPQGRFHPYLGAGLGIFIANLKTTVVTARDSDTDVALGVQVPVGLKYFLIPNLSLFGEYKFIHTGDFKFELSETVLGVPVQGTIEANLTAHLIYGGIAWHF